MLAGLMPAELRQAGSLRAGSMTAGMTAVAPQRAVELTGRRQARKGWRMRLPVSWMAQRAPLARAERVRPALVGRALMGQVAWSVMMMPVLMSSTALGRWGCR